MLHLPGAAELDGYFLTALDRTMRDAPEAMGASAEMKGTVQPHRHLTMLCSAWQLAASGDGTSVSWSADERQLIAPGSVLHSSTELVRRKFEVIEKNVVVDLQLLQNIRSLHSPRLPSAVLQRISRNEQTGTGIFVLPQNTKYGGEGGGWAVFALGAGAYTRSVCQAEKDVVAMSTTSNVFKTTPLDSRFPTVNQANHCW